MEAATMRKTDIVIIAVVAALPKDVFRG